MSSVNKVIIVGRLGADPEVRQFQNGGQVTNLSIATSDRWTDKQTGEQKEQTEWHRVSLYNRLAEIAGQYLSKGSLVYIEGSLHTRKYTDQQGIERYSTEIKAQSMQMLPSGQGQPQQQSQQHAPTAPQGYPQGQGGQWGNQNGFTGGIPNEFQPPHYQTGQPPAFPPQNGGQNMGKW
ncbi:single-stranded DNA-binding protein [Moraxella equi]|uniref:Single-stranded DNA-binding protein n=1 Tax=Moraxella equi TaxID=60442 RepID=A0A378QNV9_9GAMM|nr:single-stranded DNA-binding protein [Moraxella equi]OPH36257.1 hypothetical protein B5J93_09370 [Moraxella equi]STZ01984.1 Helix-destabilizing protein [Moraxella equi]